jgi:flagellar biosynthesis component FlhA
MRNKIGEKIKILRKESNVTQVKLADWLGIAFQSVSRWENGICYPDLELLPSIAKFFSVTTDELLGVDSMNKQEELEKKDLIVGVELGVGLLQLLFENGNFKDSSFTKRIKNMKRKISEDLGFEIGSITFKGNVNLPANNYFIKIKGEEVAGGEIILDNYLIMKPNYLERKPNDGVFAEIDGIEVTEPAHGLPAKWIHPSSVEKAEKLGYFAADPLSVFITHLNEIIKKHATQTYPNIS